MDASDWDERYAASELVWSAAPNQFVAAECAALPPGRAVDLAAGEGRNAIWLAGQGWQVTAVDFSAAGIDKGRQLAQGLDIDWQVADATTWSGSGYQLCVLAYLQLPAAERRAASRAGFAALDPGGTFLLVAHDLTNLTEGTGGPQDPGVLMTADDVLADLEGYEYDVVRAGRVERWVGGPATEQGHGDAEAAGLVAWDCLVRVTRR